MANSILDQDLQRKLAIQSLFDSEGYNLLKTELFGFVEYADACITANQEEGFITNDKLGKVNYDLGRKAGLQMILNVIQQYQEELDV